MQRAFLAPDVILSILTGDEKVIHLFNQKKLSLVTSDFALYEAISCLTKEELKLDKLAELLYAVQLVSSPKLRIDMDRIEHLREVAKLATFK